jgi:sec-independent protein translocase protein TatA
LAGAAAIDLEHEAMTTLAIWHPGPWEMVILLLIALLLFGKRLPEVGRSMGKGIVEFRRGLKGVTDEIEAESSRPASAPARPSAARPPLDAGGQDQRVVQGAAFEDRPAAAVSEKPNGA